MNTGLWQCKMPFYLTVTVLQEKFTYGALDLLLKKQVFYSASKVIDDCDIYLFIHIKGKLDISGSLS